MKRSIVLGTVQGLAILIVILLGVLIAYAADIFTVDKDGTVRLVITDTGNVGIGTANPNDALDVSGNIRMNGVLRSGVYVNLDYVTEGNILRLNGNQGFKIRVGGGDAVFVNSSRNFGVGTTDPKTKLHVTGLPEYADNAAALAAGLTAGAFYRTGDILKVVH